MARKPRLHLFDAFYHVMFRGNNGQQIFFSDEDSCRFCLLLQEGTERFGYSVHGFCFMKNHVHLVLQMGHHHISGAMQHLASRYSRYINRKEKRKGHLFQGRFKSILIDEQDYLKKLIRYVHLNPIRAGLVNRAEDYIWSSHRAYLGMETLIWLSKDYILRKFDSNEITAIILYEDFLWQGRGEESAIKDFKFGSHEGRFLGTDDFVQKITTENLHLSQSIVTCSLEELIDLVCNELKISRTILLHPGKQRASTKARGIVALLVKEAPHLTLKEFADYVEKDLSSISQLVERIQRKSRDEIDLSNIIESIKQRMISFANTKSQA